MYYDDNIPYINKVQIDDEYYNISNLTDGAHTVHLPELTDDDEFALRGSVDTDLAKLEQGKADKKAPSAVNNVALLDASGNLVDSGKQLTPEGIGADSKGAGLYSDFTEIPANSDLNNYTACGYYRCALNYTATTLTNSPTTYAFTLRVSNAVGGSDYSAINGSPWLCRVQTLVDYNGDKYVRYARTGADGVVEFGEWKTIYNSLNTSGTWTPTMEGASSYTQRTGTYIVIGNTCILSFYIYGTFAGSITSRVRITGCPFTPIQVAGGGGGLSGYTSPANVIFTGWELTKSKNINALGQEIATASGSHWQSTAIYQKSSEDFFASGTISFQIS